jgi:hypothetical protein
MFIWCWQIWQPGIPTSPLSGANFSMEDFLAAFNHISDSNHAPGYTILAVGLTNDASDQTDWNL